MPFNVLIHLAITSLSEGHYYYFHFANARTETHNNAAVQG